MKPLDSSSRLRFAPSPTGMLHVGGARTALFNWLLARGCGGRFILRIEDTDRERSTEASTQVILEGMKWLGLDYDEGPFYQSQRNDLYVGTVRELLDRGKAYPCFCPTERLDALRATTQAAGKPFIYDGRCRDLAPGEARRRIEAGEPHTIRFLVEPGAVTEFEDIIGGRRAFENDLLGDFVILRTDGSPIYQLTVSVDDHLMGVTHIIRGDDHLSNTPRQILIFKAMGWEVPEYGHVPLILGQDHARLSKRHGATSILEFAREGFLPEAMFNYLALLGWSLDGETEIIPKADLIQYFSVERFNNSAAVFDKTKLEWMNSMYMRRMGPVQLAKLARPFFVENGVPEDQLGQPRFTDLIALEIERSRTLSEMRENLGYFFVDRIESYDEKAAQKHFMAEGAVELIGRIAGFIQSAPEFEPAALEAGMRAYAEANGINFGKLVHPLRLALTGRAASPGVFDVVKGVGREGTLRRLADAVAWIESRRK